MEFLDSLIFVLVVGAFVVGFPVLLLAQTIIAFGWGAIPLNALSVGAGVFIWRVLRDVERTC